MRLLIVEDERELAESLRRGLVAEGYTIDVAHDGSAGLEHAISVSYRPTDIGSSSAAMA